MKRILILDLETTGLDPLQDEIIELGFVLWSVKHRSIIQCYSALLDSSIGNGAEPFNGISNAQLEDDHESREMVFGLLECAAERADAVLAHSAPFDFSFLAAARNFEGRWGARTLDLPWICTIEDFEWPVTSPSRSLVSIALAHGIAVTSAHRAINDCLLLARLLERVYDVAERLERARVRAARPKDEFTACTSYAEKDLVKSNGFHWDGSRWHRRMAVEDAERLPFKVVRSSEIGM